MHSVRITDLDCYGYVYNNIQQCPKHRNSTELEIYKQYVYWQIKVQRPCTTAND